MNEAYCVDDEEEHRLFIYSDPGTGSVCVYVDMSEDPIFTFGKIAEIDRFAEILRAGLAAAK